YDAEGHRVQKTAGGVTTNYVYDLSGHVLAEYSCYTCWNVGYIYLNGALKAIYTNSTTYFVHADHLGSTRLLTGYPTPSIVECDDYYPFGELTSCGGSSITTHEFTGKERDSESNLDNFGARYDSSALGRFMSPDPGNAGADPSNPQSWNMYSYVMNNPLRFIDPTGMDCSSAYNQFMDPECSALAQHNAGEEAQEENNIIHVDAYQMTGCQFDLSCTMQYNQWRSDAQPPNVPDHEPQTPGRVTQVAQCASNLANTMSVAHYAHLQNVPVASNIFSNDFSTVTNLFLGPGRAGAAVGLAENVGSGPALGLTAKGAGAVPVGSGLQFLFSSVPATTFGGTAIGGILTKGLGVAADILSGEAEAQAIYDAGIYVAAGYVCAKQ
ncbi:MAG TPA: RHS repeat-associated core domain-containing protein, partial [Candidatus Acidoferrales bacterium]|nr:RHS repeat-associated core domain-containing protein [Candidatus Acidoferrales bacterium]